jgi:hypothetical protein
MCENGGSCNHAAAHSEYDKALRRAFWVKTRNVVRPACNDLVPFSRVLQHIKTSDHHVLGEDEILLDDIIGSSGRYRDFDLRFLPRRREPDDRWVNVAQAYYDGVQLPPVQLYKVGDAYYVEDGNHRVSVARVIGQEAIRATVIELDTTNLNTDLTCQRSGYKI